jgi:hypothetical protein
VAYARGAMLGATVFLTVASGFHYALVASRRIGLLFETEPDLLPARNRK